MLIFFKLKVKKLNITNLKLTDRVFRIFLSYIIICKECALHYFM